MAKDQHSGENKSSFWQWLTGWAKQKTAEISSAQESLSATLAEDLTPTQEGEEALMPTDKGEDASSALAEDAAAPLGEQYALLVLPSEKTPEQLAEEEKSKRLAAKNALIEARLAEIELRRVKNDANLLHARQRVDQLQMHSMAAQQEATAALAALNQAEADYQKAASEAESHQQVESNLQKEYAARLAQNKEENNRRLAEAQERLSELSSAIKEQRQAIAKYAELIRAAEEQVADEEANLRRKNENGVSKVQQIMKKVADIRSEADVIQRQLAVHESRLISDQKEYEQKRADLAELEEQQKAVQKDMAGQRQQESDLLDQKERETKQLQKNGEARLAPVGQTIADLNVRLEENRQAEAEALTEKNNWEKALEKLEQEAKENQNQLLQKKEALQKQSLSLQKLLDDGNADLDQKKQQYQAAQKEVESVAAELVKVNVLAKTARERANLAAEAEEEAHTAAAMVEKLRAEAAAAKGDSDDSSSRFLGEAEAILVMTIDSANALVQEKVTIAQEAAAQVRAAESEVAQTELLSRKANKTAEEKRMVWLHAEEHYIRNSTNWSAEKANCQAEIESLELDFQQKRRQMEDRLSACRKALQNAENDYQSIIERVQQTEESIQRAEESMAALANRLKEDETELEQNWAERLQDCREALALKEKHAESLEERIASARQEANETAKILGEKLDNFTREKERLNQLLAEKNEQASALENQANAAETEYKGVLFSIRGNIDHIQAQLQQYRIDEEKAQKRAEQKEQEYGEASQALETLESTIAQELLSLENAHQQQLSPLTAASQSSGEMASRCNEELSKKRTATEQAVLQAADIFAARLEAANEVAIAQVNNGIYLLQSKEILVQRETEEKEEIMAAAEQAYQALEQVAEQLRGEEDEISANADRKYQEQDEQTAAEIQAKEQELQEADLAAEQMNEEAVKAEAQIETAKKQIQEAKHNLSQKEVAKEKALEEADVEEKALTSAYETALAKESQDLPGLEAACAEAMRLAEEQRNATEESENAYGLQAATVDEMLQQEMDAPKMLAASIAHLDEEHQALLAKAREQLTEVQQQQKDLQSAYAASAKKAEQAEQIYQQNQKHYDQLMAELENCRKQAEETLANLDQQLISLEQEAKTKENSFHHTEETLMNSNTLIQQVETAYTEAQIAYAKAESELRSARTAKETAAALAKQAASAKGSVDSTMADILFRASEGLRNAVDNAEAVIQEKQAAFVQAEQKRSAAAEDRERVLAKIAEAPTRLEQEQADWLAASAAYAEFQQGFQAKNDKVKAEFAEKQQKLQGQLQAAEQKLAASQEEAATFAAKAEQLSQELMAVAVSVNRANQDVQTIELDREEAIESVKAEAAEKQEALKEARLTAQEIAAQLEENLNSRRAWAAEAEKRATAKQEALAEAQAAFASFQQERTAQYQGDLAALRQRKQAAVDEANIAREDLAAALAEEVRCEEEQAAVKEKLLQAILLRDELTQSCQELREKREKTLKAVEEEKLRSLGKKALERMTAEEKAAAAQEDFQKKQVLYGQAARKLAEIRSSIKLAETKLEDTRRECEKALSLARVKKAVFQ